MTLDTKALLRLMKASYKGGGIEIFRREHHLRDCFFLAGADWALLIPKENCPGEITGQIVTWLADMPRIQGAFWAVKDCMPQPVPAEEQMSILSSYLGGTYEQGMKPLPFFTKSFALLQKADGTCAAFSTDGFDVVHLGENLGFLDPQRFLARWQDEKSEALFWLHDRADALTPEIIDAVHTYPAWGQK